MNSKNVMFMFGMVVCLVALAAATSVSSTPKRWVEVPTSKDLLDRSSSMVNSLNRREETPYDLALEEVRMFRTYVDPLWGWYTYVWPTPEELPYNAEVSDMASFYLQHSYMHAHNCTILQPFDCTVDSTLYRTCLCSSNHVVVTYRAL